MHVSLGVRDISATAGALAHLLHTQVPPVTHASVEHEGRSGQVLHCAFRLPNFFVEVVQHEGGVTPYEKFTRLHGDGIHHIALHVDAERFAERVHWLEQRAGQRILGGPATGYAEFDSRSTLGTTFELLLNTATRTWTTARAAAEDPGKALLGGGSAVTHVGIVVSDVRRAVQSYAELFDLEPSPIRVGTPRFAPGTRAATDAHVRIAIIRRPNVSIRLIEPVGASPMRDYLDEHGNAVHHIGVSVGRRLDRSVRALAQAGARRILGRRGDAYAQMDLGNELGFIIELTGQPA